MSASGNDIRRFGRLPAALVLANDARPVRLSWGSLLARATAIAGNPARKMASRAAGRLAATRFRGSRYIARTTATAVTFRGHCAGAIVTAAASQDFAWNRSERTGSQEGKQADGQAVKEAVHLHSSDH
jgi:hypothetical protein